MTRRLLFMLSPILIMLSSLFFGATIYSQPLLNHHFAFGSISFPKEQIISFEEASDLFKTDKAIFIDSRTSSEFVKGHIPGALNLCNDHKKNLKTITHFLPENYTIVLYCDDENCNANSQIAKVLFEAGVKNIKVFPKGWTEWKNQNMPIEQVKP